MLVIVEIRLEADGKARTVRRFEARAREEQWGDIYDTAKRLIQEAYRGVEDGILQPQKRSLEEDDELPDDRGIRSTAPGRTPQAPGQSTSSA